MSPWDGSLGKTTCHTSLSTWIRPSKDMERENQPPPPKLSCYIPGMPCSWNPTFTSTQSIIINNRQRKLVDPQTTKWCLEHWWGRSRVSGHQHSVGLHRMKGWNQQPPWYIHIHTSQGSCVLYIHTCIPGKLRSLQDQHLSARRYCDMTRGPTN